MGIFKMLPDLVNPQRMSSCVETVVEMPLCLTESRIMNHDVGIVNDDDGSLDLSA